jgi:thioredoxin-related protein
MLSTVLGLAVAAATTRLDLPAIWHSDYSQAHAEATSLDKPLFIVFCSGSSEYARMISLGTFLSDRIERSLDADYVRLLVDTDTPAGRELAKRFDAPDEPHFVILDRSGKWQVFYRSGYMLEEDMAPVLAQFRRVKLAANGRPIPEVASRPTIRLCST